MRLVACALLALAPAFPAIAQSRDSASAGAPVLSLQDAISLARRNNPLFLQTRSARQRAGAALRTSYGVLLPDVSTSFSNSYREGRPQFFGGQAFGSTSDVISSDASLNISAQYNGANLLAPKVQRANLEAAESDLTNADAVLRLAVTGQYLNVLAAQARAQLNDTLLTSAQAQLELSRARAAVGAATTLDVRRAEVQVGQAQVAVLRERNNIETEKLRLFQQLGVEQPTSVRLSTELPVVEPTLNLQELLSGARRQNPALASAKSRESAAGLTVRQARSAYLPTLRIQTGLSGYTSQATDINGEIANERFSAAQGLSSCLGTDSLRVRSGLPSIAGSCGSRFTFTDADAAAMRSANAKYPFDFTRDPITFGASLSVPIFNGFQREQRVQEAEATRNDARYNVRAQELRVTAEVTTGYRNLMTAYQAVQIQTQNSQAAREALALAQERFRVGANTFVDVVQSRADFERAESDRINAIYEFHRAYATLESAVGRPLR
ncbi:MAG TPA: TolC family protein [Gemmatimonadaceae bacterium]|nr:TolC family protein [Gemmatimonadaceae bacterium]